MIILVTGGTGFIGSHLCEKLLEQGEQVICLDNNFSGSKKNIEHLMSNTNFEFIRHDITTPIYLEVDQIYHLACPASPRAYQYNGIKTLKTNILGTLNVLGIAKRTNARILLTSTSEVYGDPLISPQTEEYFGNVNPNGIRSCYDEGKRAAESLMFEYYRNHRTEIRIARIFNTYGPKMDKNDGRVISNFINQCLQGDPITIYGDGEQTRSFCFIDDQVSGLIKLMNREHQGPINIGNPSELSIKYLAFKIREMTQSNSEIEFKDLPSDDPLQRRPDISRAKSLLEWSPTVELEEGLRRTIDYFRNL